MPAKSFLAAVAVLSAFASASAADKPEFGSTGLDTPSMDRTVRPGDDFFGYMNGGWLKTAVIPPDRSSWGDVARLREQSLARVRGILEATGPSASPDAAKFRDLYASFMDEAKIEALGTAPLKADLARIAAIATPKDLAATMGAMERLQPPFGFGAPQSSFPAHASVTVDLKDPTHYIAAISQGGLGVPDRDYYLRDDPKMAAARAAYRTYLVKLFALAGLSDGEARADRVVALEKALAETQWTRIESRDLDKIFNPMPPSQLAAIAPGFDWPAFLDAEGFGGQTVIDVAQPSAMTGFAKIAAVTPIETWRDYLSAHATQRPCCPSPSSRRISTISPPPCRARRCWRSAGSGRSPR